MHLAHRSRARYVVLQPRVPRPDVAAPRVLGVHVPQQLQDPEPRAANMQARRGDVEAQLQVQKKDLPELRMPRASFTKGFFPKTPCCAACRPGEAMWSRSCECRIRTYQRWACLDRQPWVHAACEATAVREGHTEWPARRAPAAAVRPEPDQARVEVFPDTPGSSPPGLVCRMREDVSSGSPPAQSPAAGRPQAGEATGHAAQAAAAAGGASHGSLSSQGHAPERPRPGSVPARPPAQTLLQTLILPPGGRSGGAQPHAPPVPLPAMPGTLLQPGMGLLGVPPGSALGAPMVRPPPACTGKGIVSFQLCQAPF